MKKIIVSLIIFFVFSIGSIVFAVSLNYNKVQYGKDILFHIMNVEEDGELIAEYNDQTTSVLGRNINKLHSILTVSAMKRLFSNPEWDTNSAITLNFSNGAEYIIAKDLSVDDGVFILYTYKNRKLRYKIEGYGSFNWAEKAVSPEGIYNENIIIS